MRGIVKDGFLYLRNYEPNRWPGGNPETGYLNCDGSPTKTEILNGRRYGSDNASRWQLVIREATFAEELYRLTDDQYCINNLAANTSFADTKNELENMLLRTLRDQKDPRIKGPADYFERMPYADKNGNGFYERFMAGEKMRAGWVNESDFEPQPLDE